MLLYMSTSFGFNIYIQGLVQQSHMHIPILLYLHCSLHRGYNAIPATSREMVMALIMVCWFSMHAEINFPTLGDNKMNIKVEWELMVITTFII